MTSNSIKSFFTGIGGSLLLFAFCSTFIAVEKIVFIMPVIIAFNGALSGFRLIETSKTDVFSLPFFPLLLGIAGGAATFIIVNFVSVIMGDLLLFSLYDLFIFIVISGVTSHLGAKLAVRYFNI